ncbi:MAG: FKBP-type peptidyl-prolyl cis-trans isomerase [Nocardioidaceae bacterium]
MADISMSGGAAKVPEVDFKAPLTFKKTTHKLVEKGSGKGPAVKPSSIVTLEYVAMNASSGEPYDTNWGNKGKPATFPLSMVVKGLREGLIGTHAGDRVLIASSSKDAYDPTGNGSTVHKGDSVVFGAQVDKVENPSKLPADVPTLTFTKQGEPKKFTADTKTAQSVSKLGVYTTIEGHGPKVKKGQAISAHYLGQIYPDGKVFDSSWSRGEPATFTIGKGQVIPAWDQGLVGQRVGSQVVLVVPSELGYGKKGHPPAIPANSDLIFVVNIFGAK